MQSGEHEATAHIIQSLHLYKYIRRILLFINAALSIFSFEILAERLFMETLVQFTEKVWVMSMKMYYTDSGPDFQLFTAGP
jgi:hypothetical protein